MPIKTRLTTKGFEDYLERIAQAGQDIDQVADEALQAGGAVLVDGMQARVAVDTHNLQSKIDCSEPQQDGNFHFVEVGLLKDTDADTARYGNVQEFGSANMPAHPYIRPTLDSDMGKARRAMRQVFEEKGAL
ncbi:MAG: HK97 gp10 family phage protein [Anaerolineaceae bacterium]|nr:HK97 gp10 family phage protein [Anaerolineaceae bacterium]MDD5367513.1 HK97 gp10 family phage protein [Anaerolineaceae bacterium]